MKAIQDFKRLAVLFEDELGCFNRVICINQVTTYIFDEIWQIDEML